LGKLVFHGGDLKCNILYHFWTTYMNAYIAWLWRNADFSETRKNVLHSCEQKLNVVHPRDAAYCSETLIVSHAARW